MQQNIISNYYQQWVRFDAKIAAKNKQFNLAGVIPKYNEIIKAIEEFHSNYNAYPHNLSALVPVYLTEQPGIYIWKGERLEYTPDAWFEDDAPFTV